MVRLPCKLERVRWSMYKKCVVTYKKPSCVLWHVEKKKKTSDGATARLEAAVDISGTACTHKNVTPL